MGDDGDLLGIRWEPAQIQTMETLREWAVAFNQLNLHLAVWMGLPTSDANALGQIVWAAESGDPLSPARLGQRIGMTSGATTTLLNRLESSGLVARSREHEDRRRVTLRPTETARERARTFAALASGELATVLQAAPTVELEATGAFVQRMADAATRATARLRAADLSAPSAQS